MNTNEKINWLHTTYFEHLASLIDTNMTYMHTTITWTVTLTLGVIAVVLARPSFPDDISFIMILILLVMLGHFIVRTGKAYLNIMRWSTLEKYILKASLDQADETDYAVIFHHIEDYHYSWKSPISIKDLTYKLLFELGFAYFGILSIGLLAFIAYKVGVDEWMLIEIAVTIGLITFEIWVGFRSSYLKNVTVDPLARKYL